MLLDRPGWTQSTPIDYSQGDFGTVAAGLLNDFLAALGIESAHVVGGSIGNLFALRLAIQHPDSINKIVLLGGLPDRRFAPPTFIRLLRTPLGQIIVRIPQKSGMIRKQLEQLGHKTSLNQGQIPSELIDRYAATSRHTNAMQYERDLVKAFLTRDGWVSGFTLSDTDLAGISPPTLMIYGKEDPTGSTSIWNEFTRTMPHATLQVMPDSGHLVWYDNPQAVAKRIDEHLR